jgi:GNAT superfamily N-acetyltransferase
MTVDVTTTYLEQTSPSDLKAKHSNIALDIKQVEISLPELNRFFYTTVGRDWYWIDRLGWSYAQWQAWVDRPDLQTWVLYVKGTPAGYFELERQDDTRQTDTVNLAYFGLLPQFVGKGLGSHFLSVAIEKAWAWDAKRVTVNTCTLDNESALKNHLVRGFKIYKEKTERKTLPDSKPELWVGASQTTK